MRVVAAAAAIAAACTSLPDVPTGQCGNGVLEKNEDCDDPSSPATCVSCSVRCGSPGMSCAGLLPAQRDGTQYTCGADFLCHAPGGRFGVESASLPFPAFGFGVTDVNKDHIGDVVGLSGTSLLTRYGDAGGQLLGSSAALSPELWGNPFISDIDGDGALDLVLPTIDGLAAYASPVGVMSPYALGQSASQPGGPAAPKAVVSVDDRRVAVLLASSMDPTKASAVSIDSLDPSGPASNITLCRATYDIATIDASSLAVYRVDAKTVVASFLVPGSTSTSSRVCVVSVSYTTGTQFPNPAFESPDLPTQNPGQFGAILADVGGVDTCPELVFRNDAANELQKIAGSRDATTGACKLSGAATTLVSLTGPANADALVGHVTMGSHDAIVTEQGIYDPVAAGDMKTPLYVSDRPLTMSRVGDVDGDGLVDVVAVRDAGMFADQNIDVLYRHTNPDAFLRTRLATNSIPIGVEVGDFDGDGRADIAYAESVGNGQRVSIAYGAIDRAPTAIALASVDKVIAVTTVRIADSGNLQQLIQSLVVVEQRHDRRADGADTLLIDLFHGSAQRDLIAYLDPRGSVSPCNKPGLSQFRGIVVGTFATLGNLDYLGFEDSSPCVPRDWAWLLVGSGVGEIALPGMFMGMTSPSKRSAMPMTVSCPSGTSSFCPGESQLVAWPTPSGLDVGIGIDWVNGVVMEIAPQLPSPPTFTTLRADGTAIVLSQMNPPVSADTDGDGVTELIVAYDGTYVGARSGKPAASDVLRCDVSAPSELVAPTVQCHALADDVPGLPHNCGDVTKGVVVLLGQGPAASSPSSSPSTDLVVRCSPDARTSNLYRVFHDAGGYHATPIVTADGSQLVLGYVPVQLSVADVTGDFVDDIVAVDPAGVLHVIPQLTSRQVVLP